MISWLFIYLSVVLFECEYLSIYERQSSWCCFCVCVHVRLSFAVTSRATPAPSSSKREECTHLFLHLSLSLCHVSLCRRCISHDMDKHTPVLINTHSQHHKHCVTIIKVSVWASRRPRPSVWAAVMSLHTHTHIHQQRESLWCFIHSHFFSFSHTYLLKTLVFRTHSIQSQRTVGNIYF